MGIDETLKLKEIDQLDSAILQFSKNTLATKKICASLLVGVVTIILKLTGNTLDYSIYVGSIVTVFIFWVIDSNSYFYQRKLRIRMTEIVNELKKSELVIDGYGMSLIKAEKASWPRAFFNSSQLFYLIGTVVIIVVFVIDKISWI